MKKYVTVDIGGTNIKYGLMDESGKVISKGKMKTEAHLGGSSILGKVMELVGAYIEHEDIAGVCISTAGMVDVEKGEIFHAGPQIPEYTGTRFKETIEKTFHIPCEVENDVNCAGLAEYTSGAAAGSSVMLMLTIGTGIGGCCIADGRVFRGFSGSACEVGYMQVDGDGFQNLGAASVLSKKVSTAKNEPDWDGERIFREAGKGDKICIAAIDEMAEVLGKGIANICYVLNPQIVVLGGGIMAEEEYLRDRIEAAVKRWLIPALADKTEIAFAQHRNDAGMIGAYCHFRQMQEIRSLGR